GVCLVCCWIACEALPGFVSEEHPAASAIAPASNSALDLALDLLGRSKVDRQPFDVISCLLRWLIPQPRPVGAAGECSGDVPAERRARIPVRNRMAMGRKVAGEPGEHFYIPSPPAGAHTATCLANSPRVRSGARSRDNVDQASYVISNG